MLRNFPQLESTSIAETRNALHAYARVLGDILKHCRAKRKHWWHASLRPSLYGLTTGVVRGQIHFEFELNLRDSLFQGRTATGEELTKPLHGQAAADIEILAQNFLAENGLKESLIAAQGDNHSKEFPDYSAEHAQNIGQTFNGIVAAMEIFKAGIREETSPIQVWPHHFDLSLLWLPGTKISGEDTAKEEYADKQMNFGFTLGDDVITEPYFYITAYPLVDVLPKVPLPQGVTWQTQGFNGAVMPYHVLPKSNHPVNRLLEFWQTYLAAGRKYLD